MVKKNYRLITKLARRYGRRVEQVKAGHYHLLCKRGERPLVTCSATPTNVDHWIRNVEKDLKRVDT